MPLRSRLFPPLSRRFARLRCPFHSGSSGPQFSIRLGESHRGYHFWQAKAERGQCVPNPNGQTNFQLKSLVFAMVFCYCATRAVAVRRRLSSRLLPDGNKIGPIPCYTLYHFDSELRPSPRKKLRRVKGLCVPVDSSARAFLGHPFACSNRCQLERRKRRLEHAIGLERRRCSEQWKRQNL